MAPIFSVRLWAGSGGGEVLSQLLDVPPQVVVIRDMAFTWRSDFFTQRPNGFVVYDTGGNVLWEVKSPDARAHFTHQWQGRSVMPSDNVLFLQLLDEHWTWWISGYSLTPAR